MDPFKKKDKTRATVGTTLFCLLILLLLIFSALRTPLPLPEEEGVLIALGSTDYGMGDSPPRQAPAPVPSQPREVRSTPAEDVATQTTDDAIAITDDTADADTRPEPEPIPQPTPDPQPTPEETQITEEDPEPVVDPRALFPGKDDRTTEDQARGDTDREGTQGRQDGHYDGDALEGGGAGDGVQFSLAGRKANYLPVPDYTTAAQGRVVVAITVNRNGQVTRATAGARGTTTTDRTLHRLAEDAARRARFDLKSDAPEEQTGTITYNFIRIN